MCIYTYLACICVYSISFAAVSTLGQEPSVSKAQLFNMAALDESLSEEEQIEEMKDCYSIFDRVGDMKVEDHNIINVLRSLGLNPLTEDVNKCIEMSKLKNTRIDFETFYGIFKQLCKKPTTGSYDDMVEGLGTMDRETCGQVSSAELRMVLMNIGDKMTEEQIEQIVQPHEDATKSVTYKDMIRRVMAA